ncbi:hypothetical protein AAFO92_01670 [Roseovarius sp. CAU 1744]|uniref:hypothetical protein n=1 Tax=Roseovarius sp. CAU 1744 TaxID=3140368 RepID=UPI00325B9D21
MKTVRENAKRAPHYLRRLRVSFSYSGVAYRIFRTVAPIKLALLTTTLSGAALASESTFDQTLELCSSLSGGQEGVRSDLVAMGWEPVENPKTALDVLFWTIFSTDFATFTEENLALFSNSEVEGEQLGYLVANAHFLSVSILGNSALPPDQPAYMNGGIKLATLGLSLNKGYCVITGPSSIFENATSLDNFVDKWPDNRNKSDRPGVSARFGETDLARIFVARLDREEIRALYSSTPIALPYSNQEFDDRLFDGSPPAVIHITPKRSQ